MFKFGLSYFHVVLCGTPIIHSVNPVLHRRRWDGNLKYMKRVYLWMVAFLGVVGVFYAWGHRHEITILRAWFPTHAEEGVVETGGQQPIEWHPVDQPGFKVEMPGDPKPVAVQAASETGGNEPINMLLVKPDTDHTYAIAWADKPPVARVNDLAPEKTLDQARDGALTRTQTSLVSETRSNPQGYPGRDVVAHNVGGGILDTRLIYARPRLYMLIATAPSASALHEEDVYRFFNSFAIAETPETLPPSTQ